MLFIDDTFKSSPRNFYQILNIIGYIPKKDLFIPIFSSLLVASLNLKIDFAKIKFMADYEINLRNAIIKIFPNSEIMGCYFHYIKNLYNKLKESGLT